MKKIFMDEEATKLAHEKNNTARHWAATFWKKPILKPDAVRYMITGFEICPTSGREHWQTYIEFYQPVRMSGVKNMFNDKTVHLGVRFKSRDNAREYCMKDNKYEEAGYWISGQGYRSDLHDFVEELKNGKKLEDVILENPKVYCQYRNGLKDVAAICQKKRVPKYREVEIILISGPTRCGKTRLAMEEATFKTEGSKISANHGLGWWDGYNEDEIILIDEYSNDVACKNMLTLLDGYPINLPIKGSFTNAFFKKVYITTNLKIDEIHTNALPEHRKAFFARILERGKIIDMWPKAEN